MIVPTAQLVQETRKASSDSGRSREGGEGKKREKERESFVETVVRGAWLLHIPPQFVPQNRAVE